jgi:tetratricopeptide (TPR) repeat protein
LVLVLAHFFENGRWGLLAQTAVEGQSLSEEDQLYVLMQAGLYITATRWLGAPEARRCYESAEPLCRSLNRPERLYDVLMDQWRSSLITDKLSATKRIADKINSLAREQNHAALIVGSYRALACTLYFLGDFENARQYARRGVQLWRSGDVLFPVEEVHTPAVLCRCFEALCEWHFGETAFFQTMEDAIKLAKELKDMYAVAVALWYAAVLGHFERNPAEVDRLASDLIKTATQQNNAAWLAGGKVFRGWARSASGNAAEGIAWIEEGIREHRAPGSMLMVPYWLALKAEALHLADRTSEALEAITEAEALVARTEERWWCAELHRLGGVFLTAIGAEEKEIETSFCAAITTAKEQKSISLAKRAEATYAEYRRQKASALGGHGFRLPLNSCIKSVTNIVTYDSIRA